MAGDCHVNPNRNIPFADKCNNTVNLSLPQITLAGDKKHTSCDYPKYAFMNILRKFYKLPGGGVSNQPRQKLTAISDNGH